MKKSLKVKLEMAKFLQKTLDEMAVTAKDKDHSSNAAKQFANFFDRVILITILISMTLKCFGTQWNLYSIIFLAHRCGTLLILFQTKK